MVSLRDGSAAVGIWCVGAKSGEQGWGGLRMLGNPFYIARMLDILCVFGVTDVKRL